MLHGAKFQEKTRRASIKDNAEEFGKDLCAEKATLKKTKVSAKPNRAGVMMEVTKAAKLKKTKTAAKQDRAGVVIEVTKGAKLKKTKTAAKPDRAGVVME